MTTEESGQATSEMWAKLARQLADAVADYVINDQPHKAIEYAACAEACFWQATGEGDAWNVKDVLAAQTAGERS